jgi:hypothetical protein
MGRVLSDDDRDPCHTLVVDDARTIRGVLFPVADPAGSVDEALTMLDALAQRDDVRAGAG